MASILGGLTIFKTFNCFCVSKRNDCFDEVVSTAEQNNVLVLPARAIDNLKNLYPVSDNVESRFNILIVGSDKSYILCKLSDLKLTGADRLENHKYSQSMPENIRAILDSIWDKTLLGNSLMFYLVVQGRTFVCNSFPLYTNNNIICGAMCCLRAVQHETASGEYRLSLDGHFDKQATKLRSAP